MKSTGRTLSLRERSALFLADGTRSVAQVEPALGPSGSGILQRLLQLGYLELRPETRPAATPAPAVVVPQPAPRHEVDTLSGKRSMAATRMYLFDVCERTFARGDPRAAERFRARLRQARAAAAMMAVAEDMIEQVEALAGWDRARVIRDRIEALLPDGDAA